MPRIRIFTPVLYALFPLFSLWITSLPLSRLSLDNGDMRKLRFAEGEYYHLYNRGVDKRNIFLHQSDYERFLFMLFSCNDTIPLVNTTFHYRGLASIEEYKGQRHPLVDILCFCLMPNHYHILLREKVENGISTFMQKIGTAHTMFFNTKYERSGALFQGTFKAVHIDTDEYLSHLTRYIHLNPAELREPQWKEKGIKEWESTYEFVKNYPWSSYSDYLGENRFGHILNSDLISELYGTPHHYETFMKERLGKDKDFGFLAGYTIEA